MDQSKLKKVGLSSYTGAGLQVRVISDEVNLNDLQLSRVLDWLQLYQLKRSDPFFIGDLLEQVTLTPLEKKALTEMAKIPFGSVKTYRELGQDLGSEHYARFIGSVCRKNPFPLFIPCHRVVSANGLGGFTPGISIKEKLLMHEGALSLS